MFLGWAESVRAGGKVGKLSTLAEVLSTLLPVVGDVPDAKWATAKLYAPHAMKVLSELQKMGTEPTDAVARLLYCCGEYA